MTIALGSWWQVARTAARGPPTRTAAPAPASIAGRPPVAGEGRGPSIPRPGSPRRRGRPGSTPAAPAPGPGPAPGRVLAELHVLEHPAVEPTVDVSEHPGWPTTCNNAHSPRSARTACPSSLFGGRPAAPSTPVCLRPQQEHRGGRAVRPQVRHRFCVRFDAGVAGRPKSAATLTSPFPDAAVSGT